MTLDRADVALRFAVALATPGDTSLPATEWDHASIMRGAFMLADAFLALTPPVAAAVPLDVERAIRFAAANSPGWPLYPGALRVFIDDALACGRGEISEEDGYNLENRAAEVRASAAPVAPKSEAAKYEPRVGDVIEMEPYEERDAYVRVVVSPEEYVFLLDGKVDMRARFKGVSGLPMYLRPATPAERAAAGLPSPEATRPTHIRVVRRGKNAPAFVTEGAVLKVDEWDAAGDPWVGDGRWCFCGHRDPAPSNTTWEPATPPAPVEPAKGEAALVKAARALIDEVERMFVAPYAEGVLFHREFKAIKAALTPQVRS